MAPLKFEEKMKEKLEQRAIQPSNDSWERLATQLDDKQNQTKDYKKIWWYSIAAIFIGVLIMGSIFSNYNAGSAQKDTQIVEASEESIKKEHTEIVLDEDIKQKPIEESNPIVYGKNKDTVVKSVSEEENKFPEKDHIPSKIIESNDVIVKTAFEDSKHNAVLVENDKKTTAIKHQVLPIDSLIIEDKVAGVVAQIKELQKNNIQVTDEEIDQLLLEAQREIATKKILKSSTVSASALLQDVENELDETFKQRVFEALKTGFQKVKTAVVERDH